MKIMHYVIQGSQRTQVSKLYLIIIFFSNNNFNIKNHWEHYTWFLVFREYFCFGVEITGIWNQL